MRKAAGSNYMAGQTRELETWVNKQKEMDIYLAEALEEKRQRAELNRKMNVIGKPLLAIVVLLLLINVINQTRRLLGWW